MVAEASAFNQGLVQTGRATFDLASAEAIPCNDASFNRALAVNVVYFWPDPVQVLAEIRRVVRSGGFSIVAGMDTATAASVPLYCAEYGFPVAQVHRRDSLYIDLAWFRC
jgi:arsenite methyltransferase